MRIPFYDHPEVHFPNDSASPEIRRRFLELMLWVEENDSLVKYLFRRLPREKYAYDRDFVIQAHAAHAALRASETWSPDKKLGLHEWFRLKLNFEVYDSMRFLFRYGNREQIKSLEELETIDGMERRQEIQSIAICEDNIDSVIDEMDIQELFDRTLEGRERVMMQLAYEGWTLLRMGEIYGLSESRASQIMKDAKKKVADYIRENNWNGQRSKHERTSGGTSKKPSGAFEGKARRTFNAGEV